MVHPNAMLWIDDAACYGTDDCSYYEQRCLESGGPYYCEQAPYWCTTFPRADGRAVVGAWSRCTRRCLQDCDRNEAPNYCPATPDARPGPFALYGASLFCHGACYAECIVYAAGNS